MTKRHLNRKCSRCKKVLKADRFGFYDTTLRVNLDGGYNEFVDVIYDANNSGERIRHSKFPFKHYLCHECAHELVKWLNIPDTTIKNWHPKKNGEDFCDGWSPYL